MLDSVFDGDFISIIVDDFKKPVKRSKYRCDKKFHTDYTKSLMEDNKCSYGIMMVFGEETIYYLYHNTITLVKKITISRRKNQKKGGQSAPRYSRLRLNQIQSYIKTINDGTDIYIKDGLPFINGLFVAGCGEIKNSVKFDIITKKYTTDSKGVGEVINIAKEWFKSLDNLQNVKIVEEFMDHVRRDTSLIVYGKKYTLECLENGYLKKIIVFDKTSIEDLANFMGTEIIETKLLQDYGAYAGILRYRV